MREKGLVAIGFLMALFALATPAIGIGPQQNGNSLNASNQNEILNVFKGQDKRSGLIKVNRTDLCEGEKFTVAVVLPRSLGAVWSGEADAQMVIRTPDEQFITGIPLENVDPDLPFELFSFALPEVVKGNYQFALILTNKSDDESGEPLNPTDLTNWYNGFSGLISVKNIKVRVECTNTDENEEGDTDGTTDTVL